MGHKSWWDMTKSIEIVLATGGTASYIFKNWDEYEKYVKGGPLTAKCVSTVSKEETDKLREAHVRLIQMKENLRDEG